MTFTLKHCMETPKGDERESIISAENVSYETKGQEDDLRGTVYYNDGDDTPTHRISGSGTVYVMNEFGKTVATYWLGPVEDTV